MNSKYKIDWDKDLKILKIKFFGDFTDKDAEKYLGNLEKLVKKINNGGEKIKGALVDLTAAGTPSLSARTLLSKGIKGLSDSIEGKHKVAYVGATPMATVITRFIHTFSPEDLEIKFFYIEQDAIDWLM